MFDKFIVDTFGLSILIVTNMIYGLKYIELDPKILCVCHISPNIPIYS